MIQIKFWMPVRRRVNFHIPDAFRKKRVILFQLDFQQGVINRIDPFYFLGQSFIK
jgi:hypothetical protein